MLIDALLKVDIFGKDVGLNRRNEAKYNSVVGALASLAIFGFALYAFIDLMEKML